MGVADLDDCDEEPLLVLLVHGSTDGTDGPTERVQVPPRPLGSVHLVVQLLGHDAFRVGVVQMSQVHTEGQRERERERDTRGRVITSQVKSKNEKKLLCFEHNE